MKTAPSVVSCLPAPFLLAPCLLGLAIVSSSCSKDTDNGLTQIRCENMVLYAEISEQQAAFEYRGNMIYLERTESASGIKFSDGESLLWLKGKDAIVKIGQDRYRNCTVISR